MSGLGWAWGEKNEAGLGCALQRLLLCTLGSRLMPHKRHGAALSAPDVASVLSIHPS